MGEHAIDQPASANVDRQEHSGIGATGAHRIDDRTRMKDHAFAAVEIGCGDAQRNAQLFESLHLQGAVQERHHAVVGGEAVT
jgi:hypothetical protein